MSPVDTRLFEPQTATGLLGRAFRACFTHSGAALVTVVAMLIPATALNLLLQYLMGKTGALDTIMSLQGGRVDPTKVDIHAMLGDLLLLGVGGLAVAVVWQLSAFAAAAAVGRMLAERGLGRSFGAAQAWDFVLGRPFRLVGGGIVQGVVLFGGYIIASIPAGIIVSVVGMTTGMVKPGQQPPMLVNMLSLIVIGPLMAAVVAYIASMPTAVGVEDLGGIGSAFRSFRLASGSFWHAVGAIALGGLVLVAPTVVAQMGMQFGAMGAMRSVFGDAYGTLAAYAPATVLSLVAWPILITLMALLYYDLRSRQTDEEFTPYELAIEVGGELPEGVHDPLDEGGSSAPSSSEAASESPTASDIS
jgi:hypothetical protein